MKELLQCSTNLYNRSPAKLIEIQLEYIRVHQEIDSNKDEANSKSH